MPDPAAISFHIDATAPATRELTVRARVPARGAEQIELFLPTWTPGSYLLREYARHLSRVDAFDAETGRQLPCAKSTKNRFRVDARTLSSAAVELRYRVYAHELSVRTADLDGEHAFWTHACVLLWPIDQPELPADISVAHAAGSSLACSLPIVREQTTPDGHRCTTLRARDLDDAIDAPVLVGELQRVEWRVDGVEHAIVLEGLAGIAPPPSLAEDLGRITRAAADVFAGEIPYRHYLFQALFTDQGHGGLEHRDSSTLLMSRIALTSERGYREFLGLAAHELFHAWNVKRMRPVEFWNYDYERENYTSLLWLMEGWTAYYDDLLVTRAGLASQRDYLAAMAKNVQAMLAAPGRKQLSLAESSFDAWIRLYRPDENLRNSSQNYYGNGAVAAMCLDLLVRRQTGGERSLDDVLQHLYRTTFGEDRGYTAADAERSLTEVAGEGLVEELRRLVEQPLEPNLDELLVDVGVQLEQKGRDRPFLGVAFRAASSTIASVTAGSAAFHAGLAPGDEVLALQGLRVTGGTWQSIYGAVARVAEPLDVLVARRGVVRTLQAVPTTGVGTVGLAIREDATPPQHEARARWLGAASDEA